LTYIYLAAKAMGGPAGAVWGRYLRWAGACWQGRVAAVLEELQSTAFASREADLTARIAELEGALQASHVVAPAATTRTRLPRRRRRLLRFPVRLLSLPPLLGFRCS